MIEFATPFFAWMSCICVLLSLLIVLVSRTSLSVFTHSLLFICVLLVFSGPHLREEEKRNRLPLFVDISDSMSEDEASQILERLTDSFRDKTAIDVTPFSGSAALFSEPLSSLSSYSQLKSSWQKLDRGQTNIERAIESSLQQGGKTVLLLTDGHETQGDVQRIAQAAKKQGVSIFPFIPTAPKERGDLFSIEQLHVPLIAPTETSVEIRSTLQNSTAVEQAGTLEIFHGDESIFRSAIRLQPGESRLFRAKTDPSLGGVQEVRAVLTPDNTRFPTQSRSAYISTDERERVLLVSGSSADDRFLSKVLESQSYELDSIVGNIPPDQLGKLDSYFAVLLNNVPRRMLPRGGEAKLASYVAQGGGFVMIGGDKSFGLGGYTQGEIAQLLPVEPLPPRKERKRINVAVFLVLDKSKSMKDAQKIDYAKEAAQEVVRNLKDEDYLGVIGFDTTPFVAMPMRQMRENRSMAMNRIGTLFPSGKTNLFPAMDEARRGLKNVAAGRKHMIVLTDGKIPDGGPHYITLVEQMRLLGITVSTVMMGREADVRLLRDMAEYGGGAFYQTTDVRALPRIFLSDLKVTSGEQTMREQRQYIVRQGPAGVKSVSLDRFPQVKGYVQTKVKPKADLELVAFSAGTAEPLLASWKVGKGKSIAFTSDANGRWSQDWIRWPQFITFWREVIESMQPKESTRREKIPFDLRYSVVRGGLDLDLALFADKEPVLVEGTLTLPSGEIKQSPFERAAPGRYHMRIDQAIAGKYDLALFVDDKKLTPIAFLLEGDLFGEKKDEGFDVPFLAQIASETGGKLNPTLSDLSAESRMVIKETDLKPHLLFLLALLLCLHVLMREVWGRKRSVLRYS
ncbi:MAG: VWA domain-containing protein [Bdellovibrionales bacterium]|nr:VWA domain-containing protein [Bdellovibrionales bacterium]